MLVKIYAFLWVLLATAAGALFVTGNFSEIAVTGFGFAFSAMFFAGLVGVLPWMMEKHYSRYLRRPVNLSVGERIGLSQPHAVPLRVNFTNVGGT